MFNFTWILPKVAIYTNLVSEIRLLEITPG